MSEQRNDGSILSSALTGNQFRHAVERDFGEHRCMVIVTYYTDDEGNLTFDNKQVTYDLLVLGGKKEGQIIANARAQGQGGGQYNYYERIYRATEFPFSGPGAKPLSDHNGDIVYARFIGGNTSLPIITGGGTNPLDKDITGATKSDGHRLLEEYNGIKRLIDKDGNFTITRKGGEWNADGGYFEPADETDIEVKFESGKMTTTVKDGVIMTLDADSKKITIDAGGTLLEIDASSSKITVSGEMVDIGASVSDFAVLFTELANAFNSHTHNAPQAPSGVIPTTPPIAPLLSTVGSQTVKIQP